MDEPRKLAAMQVLNLTFMYAYLVGGNKIGALIGLRMVSLTLRHGINPMSCIGFTVYAAWLCSVKSVQEGYQLGKLAFSLYEKFNARPWFARFTVLYFEGVHCWKKPFETGLESLMVASRVGLSTGDTEFGCMCFSFAWACRYFITPLKELDGQMQDFSRRMEFQKQEINILITKPFWQMAHNLMGLSEGDPTKLNGKVIDHFQIEATRSISTKLYSIMCFPQMVLCYLFGDFQNAAAFAKETLDISRTHFSPLIRAVIMLFDALTSVAIARTRNRRGARRAKKLSNIFRRWSMDSPENYLAAHLLLDAEITSLTHGPEALPKYFAALAVWEKTGMILQTALTNELCGKYLLARGELETAEINLRNAILSYNRWNAYAKAQHLCGELKAYKLDSLEGLISAQSEES